MKLFIVSTMLATIGLNLVGSDNFQEQHTQKLRQIYPTLRPIAKFEGSSGCIDAYYSSKTERATILIKNDDVTFKYTWIRPHDTSDFSLGPVGSRAVRMDARLVRKSSTKGRMG